MELKPKKINHRLELDLHNQRTFRDLKDYINSIEFNEDALFLLDSDDDFYAFLSYNRDETQEELIKRCQYENERIVERERLEHDHYLK